MTNPDAGNAMKSVHPSQRPRKRRLRRRMNNYFIYRTFRRAMKDCKPEPPVLMVPCGYGWFFDRFRQDGIPVVGVDIDPEAIRFAKSAVTPPMPVCQGNSLTLPFEDGQFDFVLNNRFLLHFNDDFRSRAFRELARVTRRFLLVHYDTVSLRQFWKRLRGEEKPHLDMEAMKSWRVTKRRERKLLFNRRSMADEGAAAGLKIRNLYYVCPLLSDRVYCLYEKV